MKKRSITLILSAFAMCSTACTTLTVSARPAYGQGATRLQLSAALDPYGDWVVVHTYGQVWRPRGMAVGWQPYTLGTWSMVDGDWLWQSELPWGWAAFHYGRWYLDASYGWVWVPDDVWGPAWVVWRSDTSYVGWAPLPPQATWHAGVFVGAVSANAWCFMDRRYFGHQPVHRVMVRPAERRRLIGATHVHAAPPPRGGHHSKPRRPEGHADARPAPQRATPAPAPAPTLRPAPKPRAAPAPTARPAPKPRAAPAPSSGHTKPAPAKKAPKEQKAKRDDRGKAKGRSAR